MFEDSPLNTDHQVGVASVDSDEEEEFSIGVPSTGPSPFSQRNEKVLFSSDKVLSTNLLGTYLLVSLVLSFE